MLITTSKIKKEKLLKISDSKIILFRWYSTVLQFSEIVKYLIGVILDYLLNFNEHIKYTSKKIAKKVGYLSRIGKCLTN
jgi:hypothetical protein